MFESDKQVYHSDKKIFHDLFHYISETNFYEEVWQISSFIFPEKDTTSVLARYLIVVFIILKKEKQNNK